MPSWGSNQPIRAALKAAPAGKDRMDSFPTLRDKQEGEGGGETQRRLEGMQEGLEDSKELQS
jgi:hypothetical protein